MESWWTWSFGAVLGILYSKIILNWTKKNTEFYQFDFYGQICGQLCKKNDKNYHDVCEAVAVCLTCGEESIVRTAW